MGSATLEVELGCPGLPPVQSLGDEIPDPLLVCDDLLLQTADLDAKDGVLFDLEALPRVPPVLRRRQEIPELRK